MSEVLALRPSVGPWLREKLLLGQDLREYLRGLRNPWDLLSVAVLSVGLPILFARFAFGLGAVTNLSQQTPWGLWIGFDMLCGVALAAGGFTLAAAVHLLGLREYEAVVRPAVLTGFLGYVFAVLGLLADLGQPWRVWYPIAVSFGTTSVMFEVGWCVFLYSTVLFLEFSPALFEWLGLRGWARSVARLTVALTAAGVVLSTLHQSSLGSLFLLAPERLHPLWYSSLLPVSFFVSAIAAGLSMVIVESSLAHRLFRDRLGNAPEDLDRLVLGLGKGAALVLFSYVFLRLQGLAAGGHWELLGTSWGVLFLLEVVGLALVPCLLMVDGVRKGDASRVRFAAGLAVFGIVVNRLDVSVVAFDWAAAVHYIPTWMEVVVSLTLVTLGIQVYRFVVNRMAILGRTA
jgi:Ni/Fe-hydrogenase subunit HybB-like protein